MVPPPACGQEGDAGPGACRQAGHESYHAAGENAGLPCRQCLPHDGERAAAGSRLCFSRFLRGRVPGINKKKTCPGLGLFYTVLSAFLFSLASLFLKKVKDMHSVEASAFRCFFQMMFVLPGLIYYKRIQPAAKSSFHMAENTHFIDKVQSLQQTVNQPTSRFFDKVQKREIQQCAQCLEGKLANLSYPMCFCGTVEGDVLQKQMIHQETEKTAYKK